MTNKTVWHCSLDKVGYQLVRTSVSTDRIEMGVQIRQKYVDMDTDLAKRKMANPSDTTVDEKLYECADNALVAIYRDRKFAQKIEEELYKIKNLHDEYGVCCVEPYEIETYEQPDGADYAYLDVWVVINKSVEEFQNMLINGQVDQIIDSLVAASQRSVREVMPSSSYIVDDHVDRSHLQYSEVSKVHTTCIIARNVVGSGKN